MEKNLGHATAYGYAKSKGYSGTEEEFAQLMADYASVGQSAAQSAEQAAASATSASGSAATATQAAQTATDKASEAVTAADTATTKASEASTSADTASAAASFAGTSAQTATTAATTATAKASEASESATTASAAKTDAESARDAAAQSASEAAESAKTLTIDDTLTQGGQAADAKETGDKITSLKEDLSYSGNDISGNKIYFPTHNGKCFNASGDGYNHIDINSPTINALWSAYLIPCEENDAFTIFTVGGLTTYAYAFIDSNGDILRKSTSNYTANGLEITAPENTMYLVVNDKGGESRVYSGTLLSKDIDDIKAQVTALNKVYNEVTFYVGNGGDVSWTPYTESPIAYNIGSNDYLIRVKNTTTTITPQQIETAAISAGLTVVDHVITGTSYAILFDINEHELNVVESPFAAANIAKTTSMVVLFLAHFKSVRMGKVVEYMALKRLEGVEAGVKENTADIEAVKTIVGTDVVPAYFESNLSSKIPSIISNMNEAGQDGTTFVFITDIHWKTNYKNSPALVKRVLDKTSVKNVFCGGDIINEGEKDVMAETFLDCINRFRFVPNLGFFPIARGNHDDNSNWSSNADVTKYAFDGNTIYNLLYSQFADRVTRIGSNWAFYFDQEATKTRFIFVDTKRNGLVIDCSAIIDCLNTVNTNWHVVFLMHFTLRNATTLFDGCSLLGHVVNAYNNRQNGSYAGAYQTATYDFTDAKGTVDLIIGGHMHADYAMNADDANNPAGVPIIATDTDSYRDHSGTEGTVNSQCFDVVTVNYEAKTIKCVRIGRGSDRTFTY